MTLGRKLLPALLLLIAGFSFFLAEGKLFKNIPPDEPPKPSHSFPEVAEPSAGPEKPVQLFPAAFEIFTPWGEQLSTVPAVVFEGRKVILPTRTCLGGASFVLKSGLHQEQIDKGFWHKESPLVMWQLKEPPPDAGSALPIAPWRQKEPLKWFPADGNGNPVNVTVASVKNNGVFLSCSLAEPVQGQGVLIQKNRLVGWTFRDIPETCYLWGDTTAAALESAGIWPDDFYQATFAGGREEYLAKALSLPPETDPSTRLVALMEGLGFTPRLSPADTPPYLQPAAIEKKMALLAAEVAATGQFRDLVALFSNPALNSLIEKNSIPIIVNTAIGRYGYESADQLLEVIMANRKQSPGFLGEYHSLRLQIFREWLENLVADNDIRGGWRLFSEVKALYPVNPEFQLLGVELALLENDWQQGETLLYAMGYPLALQAKADNLAFLISQLKGQEGKIIINFPVGHTIIPVTAVLNNTLKHSFYIDTGASMVTIPLSTVVELGIEITPDTPQRLVSTAGGVKVAHEVTIGSITLGNWVVRDTKAFVIDIPQNPKIGLLGLNFLRNFRMDLDTDKGVLILEPL